MSENGKITIGRVMAVDPVDYSASPAICIEIVTGADRIAAEISLSDFALALTGLAKVPAKIDRVSMGSAQPIPQGSCEACRAAGIDQDGARVMMLCGTCQAKAMGPTQPPFPDDPSPYWADRAVHLMGAAREVHRLLASACGARARQSAVGALISQVDAMEGAMQEARLITDQGGRATP